MENSSRNSTIYLDQPHVKITWTEDENCLHIEWKLNPTDEVYQKVLTVQRNVIRTHGCTKVVFNNKGLRNGLANAAGN